MPVEPALPFYQRPLFHAAIVVVVFLLLNVYFW